MKQKLLAAGAVAGALVAISGAYHTLTPEPVKVATRGYVTTLVEPMSASDRNSDKNWALRNIPYYWDKICAGGDPDRLTELYESLGAEYATYTRATDTTHRYQSMTKTEICNERNGD